MSEKSTGSERGEIMVELFEYVLIALACPLVLPMVKSQESEEV